MNQIETIGVDLGGTKMAVGVVDETSLKLCGAAVFPRADIRRMRSIDLLCEQINAAHDARPDVGSVGIGIPRHDLQ